MVTQQAETMAADSCNHFGLEEFRDGQQACRTGGNAHGRANGDMGTFGHMRQIVRQEGVSGLWKGNLTRMVKVAPA